MHICAHTRLQGIRPTIRIQWNEGEDGKKMGVFGDLRWIKGAHSVLDRMAGEIGQRN